MGASGAPALSLVMGTLGRSEQLGRMLDSLAAQSSNDYELIVVDQNPPGFLDARLDGYAGRVPLRRLTSAPGLSRARNVGLAAAAGGIVGFPDDDCWYRPDTVERVIGLFRAQPDLGAICGRTFDGEGRVSLSPTADAPAAVTRQNYLMSGNSNSLFVRRAMIEAIGGFDERLGVGTGTPYQSGEESDLILRGLAAGFAIRYDPALVVHHDQVDEVIGEAQVARAGRYGAGYGALLRKHRFGLGHAATKVARPAAGALIALVRGRGTQARYRWRRAHGILSGYLSWKGLR